MIRPSVITTADRITFEVGGVRVVTIQVAPWSGRKCRWLFEWHNDDGTAYRVKAKESNGPRP